MIIILLPLMFVNQESRKQITWGFLAPELCYNCSQITSGSRIQEEREPLAIGTRSLLFVYNIKRVHVVFLPGLVWAVSQHRWPVGLLMFSQRLGEDSSSRPRRGGIAICNLASEVIPALFSCLKHHMTFPAGNYTYTLLLQGILMISLLSEKHGIGDALTF